jgi:Mlc titration factor MtfA (ptsG expression regulator)
MFRLRRWHEAWVLSRHSIPESVWGSVIPRMRLLHGYPRADLQRRRDLATLFLYRKRILGAGGLELNAPVRCSIAVQACEPILNLGLEYYDGWASIVVYPAEFIAHQSYADEDGVVHDLKRVLCGEAWQDGPVVPSWRHTRNGRRLHDCDGNVVSHEFAHKLDQRTGIDNGIPPLPRDMDRQEWARIFLKPYEDCCDGMDGGDPIPIDEYGADSPSEFSAVLTAAFFRQTSRPLGPLSRHLPTATSLLPAESPAAPGLGPMLGCQGAGLGQRSFPSPRRERGFEQGANGYGGSDGRRGGRPLSTGDQDSGALRRGIRRLSVCYAVPGHLEKARNCDIRKRQTNPRPPARCCGKSPASSCGPALS